VAAAAIAIGDRRAKNKLTGYRPGHGSRVFADRGRDPYRSHQRDRAQTRLAMQRLAAKAQCRPSQTPV